MQWKKDDRGRWKYPTAVATGIVYPADGEWKCLLYHCDQEMIHGVHTYRDSDAAMNALLPHIPLSIKKQEERDVTKGRDSYLNEVYELMQTN